MEAQAGEAAETVVIGETETEVLGTETEEGIGMQIAVGEMIGTIEDVTTAVIAAMTVTAVTIVMNVTDAIVEDAMTVEAAVNFIFYSSDRLFTIMV